MTRRLASALELPAVLTAGATPPALAPQLLAWFECHGRKDLPWQCNPSPYRVWVSEVMLQQTQVATVIAYFERFAERFPSLSRLAAADLDQVLGLWAGLGYYARARNLHRAAVEIRDRFGGEFPVDIDELVSLPGIGRSTAGAILALSRGQREPILDGNAKRVLARYHGVHGWPGERVVAKRLWALADAETPSSRVAEYTQAIMDLGATVCLRSSPRCQACPLATACIARRDGSTAEIPGRRPARQRPQKYVRLLLLRDECGQVLLEKRPPVGIWGGLWSLPECPPEDDPVEVCLRTWGTQVTRTGALATLEHEFSHFRLIAEPVLLRVEQPAAVLEGPASLWYNPAAAPAIGLAAPVKRLLQSLPTD